MRRGRAFVDSTVVGASLALLLGSRRGVSRRVALSRLRGALRPGNGSLEAFGGTPCAQQQRLGLVRQGRPSDPTIGSSGVASDSPNVPDRD